jgi:hypothetical protein
MGHVPLEASTKTAVTVLKTFAVKGRAPNTGYERSQFGLIMDVQIDHVVALSKAWQTRAFKSSFDIRLAIANDPTS